MNQQLKNYYQFFAPLIGQVESDLWMVLIENHRLSKLSLGDSYDAYCRLSDRHIIYRNLKKLGYSLGEIQKRLE